MPDQNQPTSNPPIPPVAPVTPPPPSPVPSAEPPRPSFVAFEETAPAAPSTPPQGSNGVPPPSVPPPPVAPATNVVTPSGGGGKKIIFIIIALLILLGLGAAAFLLTQRGPAVVEPTPAPIIEPIAYCSSIKAYDSTGNLLTNEQLAALQPGSVIRFAATGITNTDTIDAVRFTINGVLRPEVVTQISGTGEFYDEYIIPEGVTTFDVTAQVHLVNNDTWH